MSRVLVTGGAGTIGAAVVRRLLRDPAFDVLVTGESRFEDLPAVMARLAAGSLPALCHTITYDGE